MNEQQTSSLHITPSAYKKTTDFQGEVKKLIKVQNLSILQNALITLGYEHMNELLKLIQK